MCRKKPARNGRPIASYSAICRSKKISQAKLCGPSRPLDKTEDAQSENPALLTTGGVFCFPPLDRTKVKYTKGKFRMTREGIDFEAMLTPWLRLCIGVAVLFVAATPLVYAIAALVR